MSVPRTVPVSDEAMSEEPMIDVIVVGAGIAGIACARTLTDAGAAVCVLEKSGGVGGRIATRLLSGVPFDYGAPTLQASRRPFRNVLEWLEAEGFLCLEREDGSQGLFGSSRGLRSAILRYAEGLRIELDTRVVAIDRIPTGARVRLADGRRIAARHVVTTAPFPQSLELFGNAELSVPTCASTFSRGLVVALLGRGESALQDGIHDISAYGFTRLRVRRVEGHLLLVAFAACAMAERMMEMADGFVVKTVSASLRNAEIARLDRIDSTHVKRWTYATTTAKSSGRPWFDPDSDASGNVGSRIAAGDAFGHGTLEGAWESGVAVAHVMETHLTHDRLRRHT